MSKYYDEIKEYSEALRTRINQLKTLYKSLPEGYLKLDKRLSTVYYSNRSPAKGRKEKYISIKDENGIRQLANKKYIDIVLPKLAENLAAAEMFTDKHSGFDEMELAELIPDEIQKYNGNLIVVRKAFIEKWKNEPYERNPAFTENLIHSTLHGEMVRSKSEVIIADRLYSSNVPYRPEPALQLQNRIVYPDFIILNPRTLQMIYWEHFGMMDNPEYSSDAVRKIKEYEDAGFFAGKNIIYTFETSDVPLSSSQVQALIDMYCK